MKTILTGALVLGLAAVSQAVVIDDFSGDLSNWSNTVILDTGDDGTYSTDSWGISDGALSLVTTVQDDIQQAAYIYNGLSLSIGEELQIDIGALGDSQDVGLYVGGVAPTTNVRVNYVNVYARNDGLLFCAGATDAPGVTIGTAGWISAAADKLFIAYSAEGEFECGYYVGDTRSIIETRTGLSYNDASYCGIYTDTRAAGTSTSLDNLTVIPEPATFGLVGMFGIGLAVVRRRFKR